MYKHACVHVIEEYFFDYVQNPQEGRYIENKIFNLTSWGDTLDYPPLSPQSIDYASR